MKRKLKKGCMVFGMYVVAIVLVICLTNRVDRLEKREDLRNKNASITLNIK